ncbi:MAG: hypothetical protein L0I62_10895 [Gammaproteobacteria bacterium]|nr:hypothetical protein [Gammaproteobacteria bacterium]
MNMNIGDSKALGFGVFATGVWLFSMYFAGLAVFPFAAELSTISMLLAIALLVAGVAALLRKESWLGFFFILWSAASFASHGAAASGWLWFALALINFYLWLAAAKHGQETAVGLVVLLVAIDALGQGLSRVVGLDWAGFVGAWFGLAAAAAAYYVSAAVIVCPGGCNNLPLLRRREDPAQSGSAQI